MAISSAALTAEFTNMNFGFGPSALEQALINSYASQTTVAGGLTDEQARLATAQLVGDTTAVAGLTYQFFTGGIPSEPGFFFLVNSEGNGNLNQNANDLNDPYYADFNQENRYYNF
ncbi:MAG: S-layer protein, partial [Caulobacteraceae bacterium]|nr:S-layer protein [Caulobacteraceae bacterium]